MKRGPKPIPLSDRVWPKVDKVSSPVGCWLWIGSRTPSGYGRVHTHRTPAGNYAASQAHRVVYELVVGSIPDGLTLDHLCGNPSCVNPEHLEPVPQGENTLRGGSPSARAARRDSCAHGHIYDEANTYCNPRTGHRICRRCHREHARRARAAA